MEASMLISLLAKNKLGYVNGLMHKPATTKTELLKAQERCNIMLISWILGVLDHNLALSVLYFNTSKEIWENQEERFGCSSGIILYGLQQMLNDLKHGSDDISTFFTENKRFWDKLDDVDPLSTYS